MFAVKNRYESLVTQIREMNHHYYTLDNPIASDADYDKIYDELVALETLNPSWKIDLSPTIEVGGATLSGFQKKAHTTQLYSLGKAQDFATVKKFMEDTQKEVGRPLQYSVELKFDGLSVVLRYENGFFVEGRTRGTGKIGEVVTDQLRTIGSIPKEIAYKGVLEVQGEVFMPISRFKSYNEALPLGAAPLKNPRNGAAGALRNLDPKITAGRPIEAFLYNVSYAEEELFSTQEEMMSFMGEQNFKLNSYFNVVNSYEELVILLEEANLVRPTLDFDIDGIVIKVNEVDVRGEIGYTSKYPKWAVAYKFEAIEQTTKINAIMLQVGRTGKITPVAQLEPVEIGGATITKATLNNYDDIIRKGVKIGADVFVRRSNDVIPEIMGIVPGSTGIDVVKPTACPVCESPLDETEGVHLYCCNRTGCPAQAIGKFVHFAGREMMNIDTLSEKTIEQLVDAGLLTTEFAELYRLKKEDLLGLERFGDKKADNLLAAIETSKEQPLEAFLYALGMRHSGKGTAERLLRYYSTIDEIAGASIDELMRIEDIGMSVAQSIYHYFRAPENVKMIADLKSLGLKMHHEVAETAGSQLEGNTFVLTGKVSRPRKDIESFIKDHGGKTSGSVSKTTSYLVAGEAAGSKLAKAQSLGVPVITEDDLFSMI